MSLHRSQLTMGMPARVEIVEQTATEADFEAVFDHFSLIDERFSPYKSTSLVSRLSDGSLSPDDYPNDLRQVLKLADQTRHETNGYFSIERPDGRIDPSGIVKGLAIQQAADLLKSRGFQNFQIDVGSDIALAGYSASDQPWRIGIRHPTQKDKVTAVVSLTDCGIATSGTYERDLHIYDPHTNKPIDSIISLTVIGPTVYDADRFATAAFAMGQEGIHFIESLPEFEGYVIDKNGIATQTTGFEKYVAQ